MYKPFSVCVGGPFKFKREECMYYKVILLIKKEEQFLFKVFKKNLNIFL